MWATTRSQPSSATSSWRTGSEWTHCFLNSLNRPSPTNYSKTNNLFKKVPPHRAPGGEEELHPEGGRRPGEVHSKRGEERVPGRQEVKEDIVFPYFCTFLNEKNVLGRCTSPALPRTRGSPPSSSGTSETSLVSEVRRDWSIFTHSRLAKNHTNIFPFRLH